MHSTAAPAGLPRREERPQSGFTRSFTHKERAQEIAADLAADNPDVVEWVKAEEVLP